MGVFLKMFRFLFFVIIVLILVAPVVRSEQTPFDTFLMKVKKLDESKRQGLVDSMLADITSVPLVYDSIVVFIYTGSCSKVSLPGDFNGWDPQAEPLKNLDGTSLWYLQKVFPLDARLEYKFFLDGKNWILDPRNPLRSRGGFGENSELRMPAYKPPVEVAYRDTIPHGRIVSESIFSKVTGKARKVMVYLPAMFDKGKPDYPLLIVHDGSDYIRFANMNNILDYIIYKGMVPQIVTVFVEPVSRNSEYIGHNVKDYTEFIVKELIPYLKGKYQVSTDNVATLGSSAGANISLWLLINYPEVFTSFALFSPYASESVIDNLSSIDCAEKRLFIIHGSYDHIDEINSSVNSLIRIFSEKGCKFIYHSYNEGHNYGFWRAHIDEALSFIYAHED